MSLSETRESGSVSHLLSVSSVQVICEDLSADEYLNVGVLPALAA